MNRYDRRDRLTRRLSKRHAGDRHADGKPTEGWIDVIGRAKCRRCRGRGSVSVPLFDCLQPASVCGHLEHFERQRCWLCRGSGRADIITATIEWWTNRKGRTR